MKKSSTIYLLFLLSVLFSSCASYTSMQIMQPAQITIPYHVKKIGIINRSITDKQNENQLLNVLEGIITGESIGADRLGSEESLLGVKEALLQTDRFIVSLPTVNLRGVANPMVNGPLDYSTIKDICQRHDLDALVVLEYFDSDSRIAVVPRVREVMQNGQRINVSDFVANADLRVRTTWRVYDDSTKNIIDQHTFEDLTNFNSVGPNPQLAQGGLPNKRMAINQSGFHAGKAYGCRISPFWITVQRRIYRKGSHELELANTRATKGRWTEAITVWKNIANNSDSKIAGRANYNLAVAAEREGNLEVAMEYAKIARDKYKEKWSREYIRVLNNRMVNRQKLQEQFGNN
jgi:hypothetical protein